MAANSSASPAKAVFNESKEVRAAAALAMLKRLKKEGGLTDHEYERARKVILGKLARYGGYIVF